MFAFAVGDERTFHGGEWCKCAVTNEDKEIYGTLWRLLSRAVSLKKKLGINKMRQKKETKTS